MNVRFTLEPERVREHSMIKLECQIRDEIRTFHFLSLFKASQNRPVLIFKFQNKITEKFYDWQTRNIVDEYNAATRTLTVQMAVRKEDNGPLHCRVQRTE